MKFKFPPTHLQNYPTQKLKQEDHYPSNMIELIGRSPFFETNIDYAVTEEEAIQYSQKLAKHKDILATSKSEASLELTGFTLAHYILGTDALKNHYNEATERHLKTAAHREAGTAKIFAGQAAFSLAQYYQQKESSKYFSNQAVIWLMRAVLLKCDVAIDRLASNKIIPEFDQVKNEAQKVKLKAVLDFMIVAIFENLSPDELAAFKKRNGMAKEIKASIDDYEAKKNEGNDAIKKYKHDLIGQHPKTIIQLLIHCLNQDILPSAFCLPLLKEAGSLEEPTDLNDPLRKVAEFTKNKINFYLFKYYLSQKEIEEAILHIKKVSKYFDKHEENMQEIDELIKGLADPAQQNKANAAFCENLIKHLQYVKENFEYCKNEKDLAKVMKSSTPAQSATPQPELCIIDINTYRRRNAKEQLLIREFSKINYRLQQLDPSPGIEKHSAVTSFLNNLTALRGIIPLIPQDELLKTKKALLTKLTMPECTAKKTLYPTLEQKQPDWIPNDILDIIKSTRDVFLANEDRRTQAAAMSTLTFCRQWAGEAARGDSTRFANAMSVIKEWDDTKIYTQDKSSADISLVAEKRGQEFLSVLQQFEQDFPNRWKNFHPLITAQKAKLEALLPKAAVQVKNTLKK